MSKVTIGEDLDSIVCSFCEKSAKDVTTIIRSIVTCEPSYICDECVVTCIQVLIDRSKIATFEVSRDHDAQESQ